VAELARASAALVAGVRRAILAEPVGEARPLDGPAVIVLSSDDHVVSCTDTAQTLLDQITYGGSRRDGLPLVVKLVALQARKPNRPTVACSRLRTRDGTWITVRGANLDHGRNVAIVMEPSRATEVVSLLLDAYGLTRRESQIAQCVIQAFSTEDVAALLGISPYTVQDHLKSVFDKMGLSSRRELTARLFLTHRVPSGEGRALTLADDPFSAVSRRPRASAA
jgi:DNA-binding CsgD family transcriptional regulator